MSRTDKTRPFWVRVEDPYNRRYVEESHDHRTSECDFRGESAWYTRTSLPSRTTEFGRNFWHTRSQRCVIRPRAGYGGFGEFYASTCGSHCFICDPGMKLRGQVRTQWRVLARQLLKMPRYFIEDDETWTTNARYLKRVRGEHWN
jgi:hypothetical protein